VKKLVEPHTLPPGNHAHRPFSPLRWTAAAGIVVALGIAMCTTGLQANAALAATWHAQMPPNPSGAAAASLGGVSCPAANECVAVGSASFPGGDAHPGREMEWHHVVDSQHAQLRSRRGFVDRRVMPLGQRMRRGGIDGLQQRRNSVRSHRTLERKLVVSHQDQSRRRGKRRVCRGVMRVGVGVHRGGQHLHLL
jgi:hypothetical protein